MPCSDSERTALVSNYVSFLGSSPGDRHADFKICVRSFLPEARTRVTAIAISSSMIAAVGSGRCHVWTLGTGDHYSLRLPSTNSAEFLNVSGESLAYVYMVGCDPWDEASSRAEVVTWTLKKQRTSSFPVPMLCNGSAFEFNTMLDSKGESLLLFEEFHSHCSEVEPTHYHYTRTSLEGDTLNEGVIEVHPNNYGPCCMGMENVLKEVNGQAVIWSNIKHHHEEDDKSTLLLICYNFQEDRLEVRKQIVTGFHSNPKNVRYELRFHWKDAGYFLEHENSHLNLMVIDLQNSTCSKAKMDFPIEDRQLEEYDGWADLHLGDETFLISVSQQGFCVWCFDANVRLFNDEIAYTEQRKSNMDRRLLLKRDGKVSSSDGSVTHELD